MLLSNVFSPASDLGADIVDEVHRRDSQLVEVWRESPEELARGVELSL